MPTTPITECVQAAREVSNDGQRQAALDRLETCQSAAVDTLARELRRAAAIDSADLPGLARAFAETFDPTALEVALTLSDDQAASPVSRIVALVAALAQLDPRLGPRPGSTGSSRGVCGSH